MADRSSDSRPDSYSIVSTSRVILLHTEILSSLFLNLFSQNLLMVNCGPAVGQNFIPPALNFDPWIASVFIYILYMHALYILTRISHALYSLRSAS